MIVMEAPVRRAPKLLPVDIRMKLRRPAQIAILMAAVFTGVAIALQIAMLAPYPGTTGDRTMKTLTFLTVFTLLGTCFKAMVLLPMGKRIERLLGENRPVRYRDAFGPEVRKTAFWGGFLQMIHAFLFVTLVPFLAPTALASARACIVFALAPLELFMGVLPRGKVGVYGRLALSLLLTAAGAGMVIFADGFHLFKGEGELYVWLFVALITVGNLILGLAEMAELHGVHKQNTAAAVYTLARFIAFWAACFLALMLWGVTHSGSFAVTRAVVEMCIHRWYFLIPLSLLWAVTDLIRICSKTLVSTTYMFVVMALSVVIDAITQTIAKFVAPEIYTAIPSGWRFVVLCLVGGCIIVAGARLFPQPKRKTVSN